MRILAVFSKTLLELLREPKLLALVIGFPMVFVLITAVSFTTPRLITHPVWTSQNGQLAEKFAGFLSQQKYPDGRPIYDIKKAPEGADVEAELRSKNLSAFVVAQPGDAGQSLKVSVEGDAGAPNFLQALTSIEAAYRQWVRENLQPSPVAYRVRSVSDAFPMSDFEAFATGLIVLAVLLIVPQTALLLAREMRGGTLNRIRLTRLTAFELLTGITMAQTVVAAVQIAAMLASIYLLGVRIVGSIWLVFAIGMLLAFSAIGSGLITACFVRHDSQALNVGSAISMAQTLLSGSLFFLRSPVLFTVLGYQFSLFDVFPASHGFIAMQQVLTYGTPVKEVGFRIGMTALLSVIYFVLGVAFFHVARMRRQTAT
jgi:ABC-2 type transport system permease protein